MFGCEPSSSLLIEAEQKEKERDPDPVDEAKNMMMQR